MSRASKILAYAFSGGVPRRSVQVALLVGTVLNLINQGDALFGGGHVSFLKLGLTYVVPYCVATYGAVSYRLSLEAPAGRAPAAGTVGRESDSRPVVGRERGTGLRLED